MWSIDHSIISQHRVEVQHWANNILKSGNIQIFDLKTECRDGVILLVLIEGMLGHSIGAEWYERPRSLAEKRFNLEAVLEFMETNKILSPGAITVDGLLWGGEKHAFNVLWALKNGFPKGQSRSVSRCSAKREASQSERESRPASAQRQRIPSSTSCSSSHRRGFFRLGVPKLLERTPDTYEGLKRKDHNIDDDDSVESKGRRSRAYSRNASKMRYSQWFTQPRKLAKRKEGTNRAASVM
jgi:hypothetical protein